MLQARLSDAHVVALIAGAFGVAALIGRFAGGALLDRFPGHIVGGVSLILPAIGCRLYLFAPMDEVLALAVAISLGVGVGAEGDVMGYITSRYFGTRNFGLIYGVMASAIALGAGVGPFALSVMHDHFKSYDAIMVVLLCGVVLIILLIATLGKYPDQPDHPAGDDRGEVPPVELQRA
jgi:MFS family permease